MKSFTKTFNKSFEETETLVREKLQNHGFGVLTEIDVAATLKTKLGIDRHPLKILGACKPDFAHKALETDPEVSLLLPCNVVLEELNGSITVRIVDPRELLTVPELKPLADEAANHLESVLNEID